ncbi:hypothetical protein THAOC_09235 [Thalassiosira oceanica]|uniref:Uncharacterized protein n=1 Tax=Thalassiosira oceanica TaxID=159749 RepID=K0T814_THAOC|nr:hypothetical protein THAOC_09235 [Thalassiosira oceanica]|eukprot:EJK69501.1 hypothetical protein THAOC_09235 [Thalassiosira oceanica]
MRPRRRSTWLSLLIVVNYWAFGDAFVTERSITGPAITRADCYDADAPAARASARVLADDAIPQPHRGWTSRERRCWALASSPRRGEIKTGGTKGKETRKYRGHGADLHSDIIKSLLFSRGLRALDILSLLHRSIRGGDRAVLQMEATVSEAELLDEMADTSGIRESTVRRAATCAPRQARDDISWPAGRARAPAYYQGGGELTIVPREERYKAPPVMSIGSGRVMGWRGLAHLMLSLSKICDFLDRRSDGGTFVSRHLLVNISPREHVHMISFYDDIVSYVSTNSRMATSFVTFVDPQSLVTKVMRSIVVMSKRTGPGDDGDVVDPEYKLEKSVPAAACDAYCRLLSLTLTKLSRPESIEKLTASHLSSVLAWLHQLRKFPAIEVEEMPLNNLLMVFMKRLRKHSVRSGATGNVLVKALWAATQLVQLCETANKKETRRAESLFVQLPGESEHTCLLDSDVAEALVTSLSDGVRRPEGRQNEIAELRSGAVIMYHTLLKEIVNPPYNNTDDSETKLSTITVGRIADLLESATGLGVDLDEVTGSATKILLWLAKGSDCEALRICESKKKISRLLLALQRLRVGSGAYNEGVDYDLEHLCVRRIGERFFELSSHDLSQIEGKTLTAAVRASVMMFPGDQHATLPILNAASCLITKDGNDYHQPTNWDELELLGEGMVLATCGEYELSSILWAFATAKHFDPASRALWSSSALLSLIDVQDNLFGDLFLRERQLDLFHQLAPRLLVSQLSAQEIAASLWALVQCEYLVNPGIFDALARLLTKEETLRRPLQTSDDEYEDEFTQVAVPPYLLCVNDILDAFMKSDFDSINQRHLTKVIWSIGHLQGIRDDKLVEDLVKLSSRLIQHLLPLYVTREIAITTWGLGALGVSRQTKAAVANLVKHLISSEKLLDKCKPEEASQILFTMGKLGLRDKSGKWKNIFHGFNFNSLKQHASIRFVEWRHSTFSGKREQSDNHEHPLVLQKSWPDTSHTVTFVLVKGQAWACN